MIHSKITGEISRTENVINDAVNHLKILCLLPPFLINISTKVFQDHPNLRFVLEDLYNCERVIQKRFSKKKNSRKGHLDNIKPRDYFTEDDAVFEDYKDKISVVLGVINYGHEVFQSLEQNEKNRNKDVTKSIMINFYETMKRYQGILKDKLHTTKEENDMFDEHKNELQLKEGKLRTDEKNLEKKLFLERKRREDENYTLDRELNRLREDKDRFLKEYKAGEEHYNSQLKSKEDSITKRFLELKNKFLKDIKSTKEKLGELRKENKNLERYERGEVTEKEAIAKTSIDSYDEFMIDSTNEINSLKTSFQVNTERIKDLGDGIKNYRNEKKDWESRKKKEKEEFLGYMRKVQAIAVAKVAVAQTWRKFKERNFPKKKSSGGRRKGKKGKKKGKKGKKGKKVKKK